MQWNWQQPDWPEFRWDRARLEAAEARFLVELGRLQGVIRHLSPARRDDLAVEALGEAAVESSAIEGENLDASSVRSSIRSELGIAAAAPIGSPAERGIAQVVVDVLRTVSEPLDHDTLVRWQAWVCPHLSRREYRDHAAPMQILSGPVSEPVVHFVAPPSGRVPAAMDRFIADFESMRVRSSLGSLARAGVAHLHFESIHPFEDGNGRIGRAIVEKVLLQAAPDAPYLAHSARIRERRDSYSEALARGSRSNEITEWLVWFAEITIEAQLRARSRIEFGIELAELRARIDADLNDRQRKLVDRLARVGPDGFTGGLSAANYRSITRATPATARRDLGGLVELGVLERTGERKGTRYHLVVRERPRVRVTIDRSGEISETDSRDP